MAIKVNGTTVIDDSRNLVNIASGAGSSTSYGDVGTYLVAGSGNSLSLYQGDTVSGSNLKLNSNSADSPFGMSSFSYPTWAAQSTTISGTWRLMGGHVSAGGSSYYTGLFVRIS